MTVTKFPERRTAMSEVERMAELLRRSYEDDAWAGQPLKAVLEGVTAEQAAARPIAGAHSIWEITAHAGAWAEVVRRRLGGERVLEPDEGDWGVVDSADDAAWRSVLAQLE